MDPLTDSIKEHLNRVQAAAGRIGETFTEAPMGLSPMTAARALVALGEIVVRIERLADRLERATNTTASRSTP